MRTLQELSVIDLETAAGDEQTAGCPQGYESGGSEVSADIWERGLSAAENALGILNERFPEKRGIKEMLSGPPDIPREEFYISKETSQRCRDLAGEIINTDRLIAESRAEITRLKTGIEQMAPWQELDVPLSFSGTAKTAAFIGTVAGNYSLEGLLAALAEIDPQLYIYAEILRTDRDSTYIFALCEKADRQRAEEALRELSFARPAQNTSKLPRKKTASRLERISQNEKKINEYTERLKAACREREQLRLFADYCRARAENSRAQAETGKTAHTVLIKGYVAEPDIKPLSERLERDFDAVLEVEETSRELAPVKLKNRRLAAPAELITTMYSLPSARDIDPTPLTGFFYYLLFGMMLSDAGYGLLLIIGTLIGLKFVKPGAPLRNT